MANATELIKRGKEFMDEKNWADAQGVLSQAYQSDPKNIDILYLLIEAAISAEKKAQGSEKKWRVPKRLDYFRITTTERGQDGNFLLDEAVMSKIEDKEPKQIRVMFPFDDIDLVEVAAWLVPCLTGEDHLEQELRRRYPVCQRRIHRERSQTR